MNRWVALIAIVVFLGFISIEPLPAATGFIFEGKVAARDGRPVAGAEVQILDGAGKMKYRVFSDLQGLYRFPFMLALSGDAQPYRIELTHLRYQPIALRDAIIGAIISSPGPTDVTPYQPVALLAATQIVRRDFVLTPSPGTPQHPNLGPLDPNYGEYCYRQAFLLLSQQHIQEAVEFLKIYAQIGVHPNHVTQALQLLAKHSR
jgi:hypothetical protein